MKLNKLFWQGLLKEVVRLVVVALAATLGVTTVNP